MQRSHHITVSLLHFECVAVGGSVNTLLFVSIQKDDGQVVFVHVAIIIQYLDTACALMKTGSTTVS